MIPSEQPLAILCNISRSLKTRGERPCSPFSTRQPCSVSIRTRTWPGKVRSCHHGRVVGLPAARRIASDRSSGASLRPDRAAPALSSRRHVRAQHLGRNGRELGQKAHRPGRNRDHGRGTARRANRWSMDQCVLTPYTPLTTSSGERMNKINVQRHRTGIGELILGSSGGRLCLLGFGHEEMGGAVGGRIKNELERCVCGAR
jgi:hypothetical protein